MPTCKKERRTKKACTVETLWSGDEERRLLDMRGQGKTWREIGAALGRTAMSCTQASRRLLKTEAGIVAFAPSLGLRVKVYHQGDTYFWIVSDHTGKELGSYVPKTGRYRAGTDRGKTKVLVEALTAFTPLVTRPSVQPQPKHAKGW